MTALAVGTPSSPSPAAELHLPDSTFFSTASIEARPSVTTASDGDLWPACWAADDALYAANGDGWGFTPMSPQPDIAVSRIDGMPPRLTGATLAIGDALGSIWTPGGQYNRKPTGMLCVDGALYLAIQDLHHNFDEAPAASISKSTDGGKTWQWDRTAPMFSGHTFTTLMFLDYGKDSENAPGSYAYVYGLDGNWRDSFSNLVPDPTALYLARVPNDKIQDRSSWRFFSGRGRSGRPTWSADIGKKQPVLQTERRVYPKVFAPVVRDMTVLSQSSVVYNKPLKRYLYTSWTEFTFEFYESPTPWGPWRLFLRRDFGGYPWTERQYGGYAAVTPSKFISPDGRTMYVQTATFAGGFKDYRFSLRKLTVHPYKRTRPSNRRSGTINLAREGAGATPLSKSTHHGRLHALNDGRKEPSEDDMDQEDKPLSWWGVAWDRRFRMNKLVFTTGEVFPDGGWFRETPKVQVRQDFRWVDVEGLTVTPDYPGDSSAGPYKTFTFRFDETVGDGIRIIGRPGGSRTFTSISELEVYYAED